MDIRSKEPKRYSEGSSLIWYCRNNPITCLDPSGKLSISRFRDNFDKVPKCSNGLAFIQWKFELSDTVEKLCPVTKAGYIVQMMSMSCQIKRCEGNKCWVHEAPAGGDIYWELWYLEGAQRTPRENNWTDMAALRPYRQENTCASLVFSGFVRFYCSDKVEREFSTNKPKRPVFANACGFSINSLELWGWEDRFPAFWLKDEGEDGTAQRMFSRSYSCCSCGYKRDGSMGNP